MDNGTLIPATENFPLIEGTIDQETQSLIGELRVGKIVSERGWARLYLIWKDKLYLSASRSIFFCNKCMAELSDMGLNCPNCGSADIGKRAVPVWPTLESYIAFLVDNTGKARQTILNRLGTYRRLCDERGVSPVDVFAMHLISSGAANKLSRADEKNVTLVDDSWEKTIGHAISLGGKGEVLRFIAHDVLREPSFYSERNENAITIYRETYPAEEDIVVDEFHLTVGNLDDWDDDMVAWLERKLLIKS